MGTITKITEFSQQASTPSRVDREKGIIYGVKILGEKSRNRPPNDNVYPRSTRENAIKVLEGAAVYINHPERNNTSARDYQDRNGYLTSVVEGGDGLKADYHLNPKHPLSNQILWDAEHNSKGFGFSINASGECRHEGGKKIIESITEVFSVDLVSVPATTNGIYESLKMPTKRKLSDIVTDLKISKKTRQKLVEMADSGMMSGEVEMDAPAEGESEADHEKALSAAFEAAVVAVFKDDTLDLKAKVAKFKDILQSEEKLLGNGTAEEEPASEDDAEETEEPEEVAAEESLKLRSQAMDLLVEAKLAPTKLLVKAIAGCKKLSEVKELIQEAADVSNSTPLRNVTRPKSGVNGTSAAPLIESVKRFTEDDLKKRQQELRKA